MNNKQSFSDVICRALSEINYKGTEDNNRLRAAIDDLAVNYPQEKKLFMRNADDRFLRICFNPAVRDDSQEIVCKSKASQYIQDEYHLASEHAEAMANACVDAFVSYMGKEKYPDGRVPFDPPEKPEALTEEKGIPPKHDTGPSDDSSVRSKSNDSFPQTPVRRKPFSLQRKVIILACAAVLCVIGIVAAITLSSGGYDAELQAAATHSEKVDGGYENSVIIQVRNDSSEESLTGMEVQAGGMSVVCTGCIPAGEEGLLAQTWFSGEPVGEILFDDEENVCSFDSAAPFEFRQMEAFIMDHGDNVTMETNHDEEGYATDWNDDDFAKYAIEIDNHNDMSFAAGETIGVAVIFREGKLSEGDVFYNGLESIEAEASSTDFAVLPKKLAEKDEVQLIILPKFEEVYQ